MNVLIVGGGLTGSYLAGDLTRDGQTVTVIEKREAQAERLRAELPGVRVVTGDGDEPTNLESAGIRTADVIVATTGEDEDNLVACLLARQEYGVRRTLARVNNPKNEWLFTHDMGVDVWVSQAHVMANLLREEMAALEMTVLLRLHEGNLAVVEDILQPGSRAAGRAVRDLTLPTSAVLIAVARDRRILLPHGDLVLQEGDRVIALTQSDRRGELAAALE
ncbi:MAG: potassium channel family protein [Anaerolineae bacterium]